MARRHLGKLTKTLAGSAPSKEARRVVASFLRGEPARAVCHGKGEKRVCAIETNGYVLEVGGDIVASRDKGRMSVCVPKSAALEKRRGKQRETEAAKDVRVAATLILRRVAGVSVRTSAAGERLLAAKGRAALLFPAACVEVKLPKRQALLLATASTAVEAARAKYKTQFPSHRQVEAMRKMLAAEKRMASLFMARQKRGKGAPVQADEYDYTSAPEDRGTPFNVEDLLEPVDPEYDTAPPAEYIEADASALPQDVPNPTNPDEYARFVRDYLGKMRKGLRRDVALDWQQYLLHPHEVKGPGVVAAGKSIPAERVKVIRAIENDLANKYGIVDPIHGYVPPEWRRLGPRAGTERKKRVYDPIQAAKMHLVRQGVGTAYKQRKAQRTQAAKEMRYLRKNVKPPKPPKKP
jgi:hypothetical protein